MGNIASQHRYENILDSINVIELETDMSFGRQAESNQWGLFDEPTPGTSNPTLLTKVHYPNLNFL